MSDPVVEIVDLDTLVEQVMPDVVAEVPAVMHELSTRALPENASPPRIVWVPSRDRWEAGQKRPRGGGSTGKSLATCRAGLEVHCWGASRAAAWTLVKAVVRALRKRLGPEPFLYLEGGMWLATGQMTQGEAYALAISVALDVPALPAPTTTTITAVATDSTRSTTGDGNVDAGETG